MFSLFPCQWNLPLPRKFKHHFPQQPITVKIRRPAPKPVPAPVQAKIPISEMCIGEDNDFSDVDKMLAEMENPTPESKTQQVLSSIQNINQYLDKNIKIFENPDNITGENISREELLKLLKTFSDYNHSIEQYLKGIQCSL